jgi:hypothetical protein
MATIPSRKATFTEEEKRKLVEGTDAQGKPLSESEKMKLSKMHTARTLGADWRERGAERMKAEEPARAQQALAERAAANRKTQYESPLQETVTKAEIDLPGGGKVKYGIDTLARMRDFETKQAEEKAALQAKREGALSAMRQKAGTALRQRYEDELASRGFAPPKTRQEQEAIDRARMDEFRTISDAKEIAREKSNTALKDYKYFDALAKQAAVSGKTKEAEDLAEMARETGGLIKSSSARRKFIEDQEMNKAKALISEKTKARIAKTQAQNTSTPEATVSGYRDFVAGVNQEPLSQLPSPMYQVFAGKYGKGASGRYVKPEGPTARSIKEKSKAKAEIKVKEESTPLSAGIKKLQEQEAAKNVESNKKKIQEYEREIDALSNPSTRPIGSELPFRSKTLRELKRDENRIIEIRKKIKSLKES